MHRHRANISEADKTLWERADAVCRAIMAVYGPTPGLMPTMEMPEDCCYVKDVYDSWAIVEKGERYYRIDYTMAADGTVTLSDPVEVEEIYKPVAETARLAHDGADPAKAGAPVEISESHGALLEATSETGSSWRVLLIKAGLSGNGRRYPAEVLQQAAPLFEGVKAYADHPSSDEKRHRPERSIRDVVGWYSNVSWSDEHNGLTADFHLVESADWLRQSLKSSWDKGKPDLLGFSINASGVVKRQPDGTALLEGFESVVSTDVVTTPGAGGRLLGVLESERSSERVMDPEEIKRLIQESLAASTTSLMAAFDAKLSAIAKPAAEPIVEGTAAKVADPATALLESVARKLRAAEIKDAIREAKLPDIAAKRVEKRLLEALERRTVEDSEIAAAVEDARELIAAAPARPSWGGQPVLESGDDFRDKFSKGIQGFFSGQDVDGVPRFKNLHQMDMRWQTGMGARNYDPTAINGMSLLESLKPATRYWHDGTAALLESLTTSSWGEVFADNLYKMMLKEYNAAGKYSAWRLLVSETEDLPSFQTRHWTRTGGYGDLLTVAEAGTYLSLTSPADEEVSYAPAKRGGLEDLTFEMLQGPNRRWEDPSDPDEDGAERGAHALQVRLQHAAGRQPDDGLRLRRAVPLQPRQHGLLGWSVGRDAPDGPPEDARPGGLRRAAGGPGRSEHAALPAGAERVAGHRRPDLQQQPPAASDDGHVLAGHVSAPGPEHVPGHADPHRRRHLVRRERLDVGGGPVSGQHHRPRLPERARGA